ncbi:MAG: capsule assembly Wzi family protein [Bacteroidetes bacterium]|nr:capsule assembly Wzi family protein [Bacteroidota bacterium]
MTPDKFNSWIKAGAEGKLWDKKLTGFTYGIDIVNRYSSKNLLYLHQGYGKLRVGFMTLQGGLIEERFGNQDSTLSSGGLLWSGNARPMPKVTLLVPKYTAVPFSKGYLEFMGGMSHGWFGKNQFVNGAYLHHKYFYVQAGGKLPVHIHYGLHHFAQWGGVSKDSRIGKLPSGWGNFKKCLLQITANRMPLQVNPIISLAII